MSDPGDYPFEPDWVSIPGDHIKERLDELEVKDPGKFLGLELLQLIALFEGWLVFDEALAATLAEKLGSSQQFWLNLDHNYRRDLVRLNPLAHFASSHELLRLLMERFQPTRGRHALLLHPERPTGLLLQMQLGGEFVPIELEEYDLGKHPRILADEVSTMIVQREETRALAMQILPRS